MSYPEFEYSVSPLRNSTSPLTAKLTCTVVRRTKIIRLSNNETSPLSYPETIQHHHSSSIPLVEPNSSTYTPNKTVFFDIARSSNGATVITRPTKDTTNHHNLSLNFTSLSQTLCRFGLTDCSAILRDIEEAIMSSSSLRGRGVIEVTIRKTITKIHKIGETIEKSVIKRLLAKESIRVFEYNSKEENGCVICMEDYIQGSSLVTKLACGHDFHGVCINKWLHVNHQCPMCRFPISC